MPRRTICALGTLGLLALILSCVPGSAVAQNTEKPLDPNDPRLTFSFPIHTEGKPFRDKVELDKATGAIAGLSVFGEGDTRPLQTLTACTDAGLGEYVTETWDDFSLSEILMHEDLNFDGYQDLELVQNLNPRIDCIYLWDNQTGRFQFSKELSAISLRLDAHPENQTLTTFSYWGGPWEESTYRWNHGKLEQIASSSLLGDWSNATSERCGFTFTCSSLVNGKMVTTLEKFVCTEEEKDNLPDCPAAAK